MAAQANAEAKASDDNEHEEKPPNPNSDLNSIAIVEIPPHRSHSPTSNTKRSSPFQFGQRYLEASDDVFAYNAWDHVSPDAAHLSYCQEQYTQQRQKPVSTYDRVRFNTDPAKWWDLFYKQKSSTFFKDRQWLRQEFPVLDEITQNLAGKKVVLEVGAGAGNTAFPILRVNENRELMVHAVDFSKTAVATMQASPEYDKRTIRADLWDLAASAGENEDCVSLPPGLEKGSVDLVIMIFVLSALSPDQWSQALRNIWNLLKPAGQVLFRDYGRGDLAQVRFKAGRWMGDNFYVRGDGTRVYFFDKDELVHLWSGRAVDHDVMSSPRPQFDIDDLGVDRRLIVNRQKKIKMYRCWMQGRFKKPHRSASMSNQDDSGNHQGENC